MPMPPSDQRRAAPATWRTPRRSALRVCERIPSRRRAADASRRAALLLLAIAYGYDSSSRLARRAPRPPGSVRGFIHKLLGYGRRRAEEAARLRQAVRHPRGRDRLVVAVVVADHEAHLVVGRDPEADRVVV